MKHFQYGYFSINRVGTFRLIYTIVLVGLIYKEVGQGQKALKLYEKSNKILEELVALEPSRIEFRVDCAIGHFHIYFVCNKEDKLFWLAKAKAIIEPLIEQGVVHEQVLQLWDWVNEAISKNMNP
jgi:hypothetical protein